MHIEPIYLKGIFGLNEHSTSTNDCHGQTNTYCRNNELHKTETWPWARRKKRRKKGFESKSEFKSELKSKLEPTWYLPGRLKLKFKFKYKSE